MAPSRVEGLEGRIIGLGFLRGDVLMKLLALIACAALAMADGASAQSRPQRGDASGDGKLSLSEFQAVQSTRMMRLDGDGDGKISLAEWSSAPRGPNAKPGKDPARAFGRLDRNKDGVVDKTEIEAVLAKRFARLDADKDGQLTPTEQQARLKARQGAPAAARP
jgi:hypothetical protein